MENAAFWRNEPKAVFWRKREIQARNDGRREASVYAVYAPKGGVGKTTLAVNLAVVLSERRRTHPGADALELSMALIL